jgi:hypothetical protein
MGSVSWIDYVIGSADPIDRALAAEFAANWASNHGINKRLLTEGPTREILHLVERSQTVTSELHTRIAARGQLLEAGGSLPAEPGTFEAWIDQALRARPRS